MVFYRDWNALLYYTKTPLMTATETTWTDMIEPYNTNMSRSIGSISLSARWFEGIYEELIFSVVSDNLNNYSIMSL